MNLSKFCPRCGKETDKLYGDKKQLCAECFPEKNNLLEIPDEVDIKVCSVCGRMKYHGEWVEEYTMQEQIGLTFSDFAEDDVEMELQFWEEEEQFFVRVHAFKGEIESFQDTKLEFEEVQCGDCARFNGGFFKAKIQLRGEDLKPVSEAIVDKAAEITNENRKDFLSNVEKTDGGYDYYLSTEGMNKKILGMLRDRFEPDIQRSYELVGEENGEEVYRNVVSVRIE
ncbi:60S ribosomal export protein NMD3 [Candidatus Nanohalobium constans]|nr:60S ribosomal export protein NMD3 [Candidatus Nanohalobium constans]